MFGMKLDQALGVPAEEILARRHNIWVGVSNSRWFNAPGNLERLVRWSLAYTKEHLLIWIPGRLYAVSINHVEKESRARALREGFAAEANFRARIQAMSEETPYSLARIRIADFDETLTPAAVRRRSILYRAFSEEGRFYGRLIEIAREFLVARGRTVTKHRLEASALYQLQELYMFIAPAQVLDDETTYAVEVYPGLGKYDQVVRDLIEGRVFPELTEQLALTDRCGIASVMLEET
jgi:tRNA-dependent cyclodipeptide synthase